MKQMAAVLVFLAVFASFAFAKDGAPEYFTSAEDSCPLCGAYGYCDKQPAHAEAAAVLKSHYEKKGMRVIVTRQDRRFLEAEVYKGKEMVDKVLLDLRTGRIRSMY